MRFPCFRTNGDLILPHNFATYRTVGVELLVANRENGGRFLPPGTKLAVVKLDFVGRAVVDPLLGYGMHP